MAKFGDAVVNFIYNAAVYNAQRILQGVKVWDTCLAKACKRSELIKYITKKTKNAGELADSVEAFIGFLYIYEIENLQEAINVLSRVIKHKNSFSEKNEKEICTEAFTQLIQYMCKKYNI